MHDIFISYSTKDQFEADLVKRVLENNGISCWMAPASIPGGSNYAREIPSAIRNAQIFLLLLSNAAQSSKWVPKELDLAVNERKVIIPFLLENCEILDEFNFYLIGAQRLNAYYQRADAMKLLVSRVQGILSAEEAPQPIPSLQPPSTILPEYSSNATDEQLADFVQSYVERDVVKCSKAFRGGNQKVLRNSLLIPEEDTVFLAHDDTLFRTGKNGFALCSSGIYNKSLMEEATYVDWQTFLKFQRFDLRGALVKSDIFGCLEEGDLMVAYVNGLDHADQVLVLRFLTRLSEAMRRVFV